jgi:medium-chain acyl-[acyl-carrier-protein] hydrolase
MNDRFVFRPLPRPHATLRLFCFSPAGHGAALYRDWGRGLPQHVEVCAVRFPGRENVRSEPLLTSFAELVEKTADIVAPYLDLPFAMFGHSMGSFVAFEVLRLLRERRQLAALALFVSGRWAPQIVKDRAPIHELPQPELIAEIQRRYNGIPQAVLNEPEILDLTLPIVRADFAALTDYRYIPQDPFSCPVACYGGLQDSEVSVDDLDAWRVHTTGSFELQRFPGDHFFLTGPAAPALRAAIANTLERCNT